MSSHLVGFKVARKRAHKELAHLTTSRKTPPSTDKDWDFDSVSKEMSRGNRRLHSAGSSRYAAQRNGYRIKCGRHAADGCWWSLEGL